MKPKEHANKVGTLPVITVHTLEPLLRRHINIRAQALYFSLYKIFGMDETEHIPRSIVFSIARTLQFGMSTFYDFGTFLTQEIQNGLVKIARGKMDKPFL